ncbi:MAG: sulfatase-like hydrolase/transferase [Phycisphaeraceae bacterium]|nr:sulfatase-like hydrolase/transferase [Phycisphaeraceae bacterium]
MHLQHSYGWHGLQNGKRHDRSDEEQQKYTALYYGAISFLDAQIGRVLEALTAAGVADNTYIVFTTDHGNMLGNHWLNEKGPWGYEESLRVPLLISGPGIPAGQRSNALTNHIDLAPTFAQWAGGETFGQGVSLAQVCQNPKLPLPRTVTVSEFNDTAKILRDQRWTFCYYPGSRETELYDRNADPLQHDNLAGRAEFFEVENRFLRELVEFEIQQKPFRSEAKDLTPQRVAALYQYRAKQLLERGDLHSMSGNCDVDDILSWFTTSS